MGDGYKFATLKREILALSHSDIWDAAKLEWRLSSIFDADEPQPCLCGYPTIIEVCVIRNIKTGKFAEVGNVCVNRFLGISSQKIFAAIKRIKANLEKALNPEAVELFFDLKVLNDWERRFYHDTWRKNAGLSSSQLAKRQQINAKVLANMARAEAALSQNP